MPGTESKGRMVEPFAEKRLPKITHLGAVTIHI